MSSNSGGKGVWQGQGRVHGCPKTQELLALRIGQQLQEGGVATLGAKKTDRERG